MHAGQHVTLPRGGLPSDVAVAGKGLILPRGGKHVVFLELRRGRRLLGTNGGSLWLWCCLAQPGALGP